MGRIRTKNSKYNLIGIAAQHPTSLINPLNIPGLKAWWDARLTTGFTEGACTGLIDLSPNGNTLVATSPNRPINKADLIKSGYRSIYFPPSIIEIDWLTVQATTPVKIFCPNGYSVFVTGTTFSSNATSTNPNVNPPNTWVGDVDAGGIYCNFGLSYNDVVYCYYDSAGAGWTSYSSTGQLIASLNRVHNFCVTHSTAGIIDLYVDGVNVGNFTSATAWSPSHGMSILGVGYGYADQANDGNLFECMVFDDKISADTVKRLSVRSQSIYGTQFYL